MTRDQKHVLRLRTAMGRCPPLVEPWIIEKNIKALLKAKTRHKRSTYRARIIVDIWFFETWRKKWNQLSEQCEIAVKDLSLSPLPRNNDRITFKLIGRLKGTDDRQA